MMVKRRRKGGVKILKPFLHGPGVHAVIYKEMVV